MDLSYKSATLKVILAFSAKVSLGQTTPRLTNHGLSFNCAPFAG